MPTPAEITGSRTAKRPHLGRWSVAFANTFTAGSSVVAKAGVSGIMLSLTSAQLHVVAATVLSIMEGASVIWRGYVPANTTLMVDLPGGIFFSVGASISIVSTVAGAVNINLQGSLN